MRHVWSGYRLRAWGHDEITPGAGGFTDSWGGMGMQILESLDTLWLMGMHEEFNEAASWVGGSSLDFSKVHGPLCVFETTIRALGGLLSAHALSGRQLFADKTSIAEAGSLQLEFGRLSEVTGNPKFKQGADLAHQFFHMKLQQGAAAHGLFPVAVDINSGIFSGKPSWGAAGDSFYEYLLKCWLAQGRDLASPLLDLYNAAMDGLRQNMIHTSKKSALLYIAGPDRRMQHLACFVPGLLALGAHVLPDAPARQVEFDLAEKLAATCFEMYRRFPTGLSPETVAFDKSSASDFEADKPHNMWNLLRPEAVESFFVLHQLTGDPKYRDWGHQVFVAFNKSSRSPFGFGAHPDVTRTDVMCCAGNDDKEPTFFAAETLKYLYLLQDPDHIVSLDEFVFNTEAHPFPLAPKQ